MLDKRPSVSAAADERPARRRRHGVLFCHHFPVRQFRLGSFFYMSPAACRLLSMSSGLPFVLLFLYELFYRLFIYIYIGIVFYNKTAISMRTAIMSFIFCSRLGLSSPFDLYMACSACSSRFWWHFSFSCLALRLVARRHESPRSSISVLYSIFLIGVFYFSSLFYNIFVIYSSIYFLFICHHIYIYFYISIFYSIYLFYMRTPVYRLPTNTLQTHQASRMWRRGRG